MRWSFATIVLVPRGQWGPFPDAAERRRVFRWAADAGFEGVELSPRWCNVLDLPPAGLRQLADEVAAAGLCVSGLNLNRGILTRTPHAARHLAEAERAIERTGISWTFLRANSFMQNFVNYYGVDPFKNSPVYLPHGQGGASWIDARDVGEVAARVLTETGHDQKAYTLTGGEAVSTADAIAILGEALGREYQYLDVPEAAAGDQPSNRPSAARHIR